MGFASQPKVLYKSRHVPFDNLCRLIHQRYNYGKLRNEVAGRTNPAVAIDANLVGYSFLVRNGGPVAALETICQSFTANKIDVHVVADGPQ